MKKIDLSKHTRYNTIKDAYEAAVKDGKSCILSATPKGGGKPVYVIFPYKEWRKFDTYTFKDDGYKYSMQLTLEEIGNVKAAERFETEELAIERYVALGDIFNWIYKDDDSGDYLIDPKNTDALPNAGYKPLPDTRDKAIDEFYKQNK
ncbi:MAG: hypothetical protein IKG98_12250 [Ruminococcus sp.]|nr:hypothetical protein [Ruminococcus sp.]